MRIIACNRTFLFVCSLFILVASKAQTGTDTSCANKVSLYQKLFGGTKEDNGHHLVATADSGYVIVGQTKSFGSGGFDALIQKVNKQGSIVWSKTVGGS